MAFKYFYENNVDISVIETGLGGRLDATNIINPVASVITTISLEHTNILGSTIPEIAFEKGEIIKPKSKVFTGLLSDEADKVITDKCRSVNSALFKLKDYLTQYNEYPVLENETGRYVIYKTPLRGKHQLTNAALAVLSVTESGMIKSPDSILKGIKNVIPNSGIQGRYEVYSESPKIIFDSSHNAEGIESFKNEFVKEEKEYSKKHLIFGVMKDKNIEVMVKLLDKHFDNIYAVTFEYERAAGIGQIQKIASGVNVEVKSLEQPVKFIKEFKLNKSSECLVVLGSIYLLGNIKPQLVSERT